MTSALQAFYDFHEKALRLEQSGEKLIKLHVGATGLPVPVAALRVLRNQAEGPRGYTAAAGIQSFRAAAAEREGCSPENIVVGPGSKFLIYALCKLLGKPGKPIAIPQPAWPAYELIARELGLEIHPVASRIENAWQCEPFSLSDMGMALVCNPLNPTSTCYNSDFLRNLGEECRKRSIPFIIDEAYRDIAFEPLAEIDAIRVRSFSKEFNMEGLRLGYVVAPVELARELVRFMQITVTCVSTIIQEAGAACLLQRESLLKEHRELWRTRLSALDEALTQYGFEFTPPQAGMYIFARHAGISDSSTFAMKLLDHGVAIAPGSAFGSYPEFIRIAASANPQQLVRAVETMSRVIQEL